MKKGIVLLIFSLCFFPVAAFAKLRPLISLAVGGDAVRAHLNQNITLIPPFQNSYDSGGTNLQPVGGLFLGAEVSVPYNFLGQLGFGYYQNKSFIVSGSVYQFTDPTFNNLAYQYRIESQRFIVETKGLATFQQRFHPYLTLGAGEAINQAYQYAETPVDSDDVPMAAGFNNHSYHSFTYQVGLGLEVDLTEHLRCGGGYRYVDLGTAGLGTSPLQEGTETIKYNHLRVNEFLVQLTYLG